jgi:hypothetical protein
VEAALTATAQVSCSRSATWIALVPATTRSRAARSP